MAVVYGVLGLIVILSAQTFGTINASPWFNLGIAVLFVALALAMFDVFEIDFSKYSANVGTGSSRGSVMLAFTMGGVAALLAGACVAPVVIQVVLFSTNLYATGTSAALALPFVLGLGMAAPWPFAGAGISALPKPGAWMVRVKQGFGVIIMLTAAYYAYTAYGIFRDRSVDPAQVSSSVDELLKEGWHADLAEGLAVAQREGKPVLIDMWATWCKNCLTMDKTTLVDPSVKAALDGFVKIKFQAESPDESPAREVMQRFGAVGLPTYVVLTAKKPGVTMSLISCIARFKLSSQNRLRFFLASGYSLLDTVLRCSAGPYASPASSSVCWLRPASPIAPYRMKTRSTASGRRPLPRHGRRRPRPPSCSSTCAPRCTPMSRRARACPSGASAPRKHRPASRRASSTLDGIVAPPGGSLTESLDAVDQLTAAERRARTYVSRGEMQLAGDVIFTEVRDLLAAATDASGIRPRRPDARARSARRRRSARSRSMLAGGALAVWIAIALLLHADRNEDRRSRIPPSGATS